MIYFYFVEMIIMYHVMS